MATPESGMERWKALLTWSRDYPGMMTLTDPNGVLVFFIEDVRYEESTVCDSSDPMLRLAHRTVTFDHIEWIEFLEAAMAV